jgi:FMN reductase
MFIVGLGGALRPGSSTERVIALVLRNAETFGAKTALFVGEDINLPMYVPNHSDRCDRTNALIAALRGADGVVVGSPGYHGGISGMVKNALDYTEDMSRDAAPYLDGRAVACVATGAGWQGANATLSALRNIVHALRGWPTPLGIALNTRQPLFGPDGECLQPEVSELMRVMALQLVTFAAHFGSQKSAGQP